MQRLWAKQALTADGWKENICIEINDDGRIGAVAACEPGTRSQPADATETGVLLPAPANLHSHSFQRAMAGLTERRGPDPRDSFWTWRQLMYRFLDRLDPGHIEAIAAFVQMEMLEAGFGCNVEFHYLHHQPDGTPYDSLAETGERIAAAAEISGAGLTLLPVLYRHGGCDRRPLGKGQIRFGNDPDRYARLVEGSGAALSALPRDARLGVAPHSLRAATVDDLYAASRLVPDGPIHMHFVEQTAEVAEIEAAFGARPVPYLLDNLAIDERWCLIHCTQLRPRETRALARAGVVAGLCPITESSLGDGIFDGVRWLEEGGAFGVGSDSDIRISLAEELRTLEYSQRLRDHSRAMLATPERSTGRRLFEDAAIGGARAAGRGTGRIEAGQWADLLALDTGHVDLEGRDGDSLLDTFVFTGDNRMIGDVWSAGRHMVKKGRHVRREAIEQRYRSCMRDLAGSL